MSNYKPRFSGRLSPPSPDSVSQIQTFENWSALSKPYRGAWDVWTRAVEAAQGRGPGVYDDEIIPAGTTLSSMAGAGGMAFARPSGSLGAMGRPRIPIPDEMMERAFELSAKGIPTNRIAQDLGLNRITLQRRLSEHGVAGNGQGAPGIARALPSELDEQLGKAYINNVPVNKLVLDYNVDPMTVRNAAKRLRNTNKDYEHVVRLPGKDRRAVTAGAPTEGNTMAGDNKLMQLTQSGGSPYDEDAYMNAPNEQSRVNEFLNSRIRSRMERQVPRGGDSDMMMMYGPEDQVAYDQQGNPIPIADPNHPRNQKAQQPQQNILMQLPQVYPQRR